MDVKLRYDYLLTPGAYPGLEYYRVKHTPAWDDNTFYDLCEGRVTIKDYGKNLVMFEENGDHALGGKTRADMLLNEMVIGPATYAERMLRRDIGGKPVVTLANHEQLAGSSEKLDTTKSKVWLAREAIMNKLLSSDGDKSSKANPSSLPGPAPTAVPPSPMLLRFAEFMLNNDSKRAQ